MSRRARPKSKSRGPYAVFRSDDDVFGLDVSMNDLFGMRVGHSRGDGLDESTASRRGKTGPAFNRWWSVTPSTNSLTINGTSPTCSTVGTGTIPALFGPNRALAFASETLEQFAAATGVGTRNLDGDPSLHLRVQHLKHHAQNPRRPTHDRRRNGRSAGGAEQGREQGGGDANLAVRGIVGHGKCATAYRALRGRARRVLDDVAAI